MQRTILLRSVLLNFSFYKLPVYLFKISEISTIFGSDFATTAHAYLAHCLELTKFIVVHLNLVLIALFNGEISIIPSMSSLRL